jgi:hypothetical protein
MKLSDHLDSLDDRWERNMIADVKEIGSEGVDRVNLKKSGGLLRRQ